MAFDFSKLKRPNKEEMEAADQERRNGEIKEDHEKRLSYCKYEIRVALTYDTEIYFTATGSQRATFRGRDTNGREIRAIWYAPDHLTRDETDALVRPMLEGANIVLKGYWKCETSGAFTFKAQFVELAAS
jgi:hypothetical protein